MDTSSTSQDGGALIEGDGIHLTDSGLPVSCTKVSIGDLQLEGLAQDFETQLHLIRCRLRQQFEQEVRVTQPVPPVTVAEVWNGNGVAAFAHARALAQSVNSYPCTPNLRRNVIIGHQFVTPD